MLTGNLNLLRNFCHNVFFLSNYHYFEVKERIETNFYLKFPFPS